MIKNQKKIAMKKITLLFMLTLITVGIISAQNYEISFSVNGSESDLKSVKVQNLNKGTEVVLTANQTLLLSSSTNLTENDFSRTNVKAFPNPFVDKTTIEFSSPNNGSVKISIFDLNGRIIIEKSEFIKDGFNQFEISGIRSGIYFCMVIMDNYEYGTQIISHNNTTVNPEINFVNRIEPLKNTFSKSKVATIHMYYSEGDLLLATAYTNEEAAVKTFVPTHNQNIEFEMYSCTDADGNQYKTVEIGNQVWMAENLRTTKFNDGSELTLEIDNWSSVCAPAYCWFNHDPQTYGEKYGALYNFYAVNHEKNICPNGWHVPTDEDFSELYISLGSNVGGKLKEQGHQNWQSSNIVGTNKSGFTALPSGYRGGLGGFLDEKLNTYFWTSTPSVNGKAWIRSLSYEHNNLNKTYSSIQNGFSVRCLKD